MPSLCRVLSTLLFVCLSAGAEGMGSAQTTAPETLLAGTVEDPSGARIPLATVHVAGHGMARDLHTDSVGHFETWVPRGDYSLTIAADGFRAAQRDVHLGADADGAPLHVSLQIAARPEEIAVADDRANSTSAADNLSSIELHGPELEMLSDDDATFRQELLALAGGIGKAPQVYVDGFTGARIPPKNAIRAVRINRNPFSAQWDQFGLGRVEIDTKPGADRMHGTLNVAGSDNVLNSSDPYASSAQPPYYFLNFDGNVSGPLGKKTSWMLAGVFNDLQNSVAVNAFAPAQISEAVPDPQKLDTASLRIDRQVTPDNTFTGRFEFDRVTLNNGGVGQLVLPSQGYASTLDTSTLQLSDEQIIGLSTVNQSRFEYVRTRLDQHPVSTPSGSCVAPLSSATCTIVVQGSFAGGADPAQLLRDSLDHFEFQDYLSVEHRTHFLRLGARYRLDRDANTSTAGYNGQFTFASLVDYAANQPSQYTLTAGKPSATVLTGDLAFYAEDEWKAAPNLTVDYGVRFESQSAIPDHFDPGPRVGISWAAHRKGAKTPLVVLRGSFGVFYTRFPVPQLLTSVRQNGVSQQSYILEDAATLKSLYQSYLYARMQPPIAAATPTPWQLSPRLRSSYDLITQAVAEHSFGRFGAVSVTWLNARGVHQYLSRNVNAPMPGTGARPLGGNGNVYQFSSDGMERANILVVNGHVTVARRLSMFSTLLLIRHDTDFTGVNAFPSNQYNLAQDYGRENSTAHRQFFSGASLRLPHGFTADAFFTADGGTPFNITTGTDLNGDSIFNDRPSFATSASPAGSVVATRWGTFDLTPQPGEKIIPINYGIGPMFVYLQFSAGKTFTFGPRPSSGVAPAGAKPLPPAPPRYSLSFSVEAQNLLNHANGSLPVGVLSSPLFGQSLSQATNYTTNTAASRYIYLRTAFSF